VAGYTVDPETVFRVSVQYLDTKNFVYGIADGTAGDLSSSAGMAGAASFNGGQIDTASGMRRQSQNCDPSEAYAALPATTGMKQTSSIPVISRFWPQGNPDELRAAARVWRKAADLIDDAQSSGARQATPIVVYCYVP
jgi:hypothetical protein